LFNCNSTDKKEIQNEMAPSGMAWIPEGIYKRGALNQDRFARQDEKPSHTVKISGFYIDITEVTNAQFKEFVDETGYVTTAEIKVDWNELKKQLPEGTEKPPDSILEPGSLSFHCKHHNIQDLNDYSQWWEWKIGANWKHPNGEDSSIEGKENFPVVHISFEDALAYCKWANRRLPTEAEWEYASRGGLTNSIYSWGNDKSLLTMNANTWQGEFPNLNTEEDGFINSAPVKSYPANGYGLYDMLGNVWEWTQDWYDYQYYKSFNDTELAANPLGPSKASNPSNPFSQEKVIRGGSFLCQDTYCASYRVSARMGSSVDTGLEHLGFRTVVTKKMLSTN
jgi:formylglycine-generating enzyme required for sulfatase activity